MFGLTRIQELCIVAGVALAIGMGVMWASIPRTQAVIQTSAPPVAAGVPPAVNKMEVVDAEAVCVQRGGEFNRNTGECWTQQDTDTLNRLLERRKNQQVSGDPRCSLAGTIYSPLVQHCVPK
jgi:hypothetical protein